MVDEGQSKGQRRIETCVNVGTGMVLAYIVAQLLTYFEPTIQTYIYTKFVFQVEPVSNIFTTCVFTFFSIARGLMWRNFFNKLMVWLSRGLPLLQAIKMSFKRNSRL